MLTSHVEKAQKGNEKALSYVLEQLQPIFRAFFLKRLGSIADVDDLVQNSLLRVHRGISDLHDPTKLKSFAMKGALFELNDFFRGRYSLREALSDTVLDSGGPSEEIRLFAALDVEKALESLSPRAREIIVMRESGFRYTEIASKLGSTEAAVKMQVKRAFTQLRELLL